MFNKIVLALIASSICLAPASADTVGVWCDTLVPGLKKFDAKLTLIRGVAGELRYLSEFQDGSSREGKLIEKAPGIYLEADSQYGDGYSFLSGGAIRVFDDDGEIRTIQPYSNSCGYKT